MFQPRVKIITARRSTSDLPKYPKLNRVVAVIWISVAGLVSGQLLPEGLGDFALPGLGTASESPDGAPPKKSPLGGVMPSLPKSLKVTHDGSIQGDREQGTIRYLATDGVVQVRADNGMQLFAEDILVDTQKKFILLRGDVSVYQGSVVHRGKRAVYYYETRQLETSSLRTGLDPVLLEAKGFRLAKDDYGRDIYVGEDAGITTHDFERPNYWLRSKETTIYPGDKVTFKNLKFYAGDTPIFWLPYLSQPLDRELGYHFIPGGRSNLGIYLKNSYGMMLGGNPAALPGEDDEAWLLSKTHVDLYSRRGVGLGLDLIDTRLNDNPNLGWLKLYYIHDFDPNLVRASIPRSGVKPDRYQAILQHRKLLPFFAEGTTYADINLNWHSDRFYLEDFRPDAFRRDPEPDNTISFIHRRGYNHFNLMARVRPNPFYQSDTRFPELYWDRIRSPFFNSNFLYETQNSVGVLREDLADYRSDALNLTLAGLPAGDPQIAEIQQELQDTGYLRAHSWHELSYPINYNGWLNLTPRAGLGFTAYRDTRGTSPSHNRLLSFWGIDSSVKFSKAYPNIQSKKWGIDEFLHVIEPYASFSTISAGDNPPLLKAIDRLTPSTRPPPIHLGRYTAIDEIFDSTILRLGMHNRLLTKRNGGTHRWLTLNTYLDVFLDDSQFNREYSNLYNDLNWHPLPWVYLSLETQLPLIQGGSGFTEIVTSATFMPHENWEVTLGHRYLNSHPILLDSNRVDFRVYARLNENWGMGAYNRWELENGDLELQQYTLHHNVESWVISAGIFHRNNTGKDDWGGVLSFTLKELPGVSLPLKVDAE